MDDNFEMIFFFTFLCIVSLVYLLEKRELEEAKVKLLKEVEERKKLSQSLFDSEERVSLALKSSKTGTWDWDLLTGHMYFDEYKLKLFKLKPGEFKETLEDFMNYLHPEDLERISKVIEESIANLLPVNEEYRIICKDGTVRYISSRGKVYGDANGSPIKMTGVCWDITDKKEVEAKLKETTKELAKKAKELKRSNRDLENFAYIASHDLQEPLRKVIAFGDRLVEKYHSELNDQGRDYIERMQKSTIRMQKLLKDLLNYSKLNSQPADFKYLDLNETFTDLLSDIEHRIVETSTVIGISSEFPVIYADENRIRELFQNLILNAIKFAKEDVRPYVEIEVNHIKEEGTEYCEISFKDNGIGFDDKYSERIFQQYQRLHGMNEYEGTGMGLAICKKIALQHDGDIRAESQPGYGSAFIVKLPIAALAVPA